MRLFADECVARTIIERLRRDGFDIVEAADVCPTANDDEVLAEAYQDGRVLITADKDFGELAVATRANIAASRLSELGDRMQGNIVTIEPGRMRARPLPSSGA